MRATFGQMELVTQLILVTCCAVMATVLYIFHAYLRDGALATALPINIETGSSLGSEPGVGALRFMLAV